VGRDRQARTGGPGHSPCSHRTGFPTRATVAAVFFLLLLAASPASADPCPLTDPDCITDTVDETVDTVDETIAAAEETAGQVAEGASEAVEETTTEVVGQVSEVIDELLGSEDPEPGGGNRGRHAPRVNRPRGREHRGGGQPVADDIEPRETGIDAVLLARDAVPGRGADSREGRAGGIGAAAKQLAFPALLAALVLAFLVIQNRLDRRDPRLASAPLGPDLLRFE
jgi:hypothetical protein